MSISSNPAFFSGWAGFGQTFSGGLLSEPVDGAYARRPISYSSLDGNHAEDVSSGTIGPSTTAWAGLSFVGLYDALTAGNLLAVIQLERPANVLPGTTLTTNRLFSFSLSTSAESLTMAVSWVAGTQIGTTPKGLAVTSCCNVQVCQGVLSAIGGASSFASLSALPSVQPAAGSGVLWNNGGVICVA